MLKSMKMEIEKVQNQHLWEIDGNNGSDKLVLDEHLDIMNALILTICTHG